jgi:hypothetical protein
MWIMTNKGFISIVADRNDKNNLMVRARIKEHLPAIFGEAVEVTETPDGDYRFRTTLPRYIVSAVVAQLVTDTNYTNFKNSVPNGPYHDALMETWNTMYRLQQAKYGYSDVRYRYHPSPMTRAMSKGTVTGRVTSSKPQEQSVKPPTAKPQAPCHRVLDDLPLSDAMASPDRGTRKRKG